MNIGIIGFGNLGKALVSGMIFKNIVKRNNIFVCAKSEETLNLARNVYEVNASDDINYILSNSDIVFFIVKKMVFSELCTSINGEYIANKTIISFMAGVTIEFLHKSLNGNYRIVRAMPSIAISQGSGVIGYTPLDDHIVISIFENLGYAFCVEEQEIEKVTALSACGLGFAAYILNSFVQSGIRLGFSHDTSKKIVSEMFSNAVQMSDYKKTVLEVATKGGATEQGLEHFEQQQIDNIIEGAIMTAYNKVAKS